MSEQNSEKLAAFSISGHLTDGSGNPMEGVPITLSGTVVITRLTCRNGSYSFTSLPNWGRYQITPGSLWREGAQWKATPLSYQFNGLTRDVQADFLYNPQYE